MNKTRLVHWKSSTLSFHLPLSMYLQASIYTKCINPESNWICKTQQIMQANTNQQTWMLWVSAPHWWHDVIYEIAVLLGIQYTSGMLVVMPTAFMFIWDTTPDNSSFFFFFFIIIIIISKQRHNQCCATNYFLWSLESDHMCTHGKEIEWRELLKVNRCAQQKQTERMRIQYYLICMYIVMKILE